MTLHPPKAKWKTPTLKVREVKPVWRNAAPATIGSVLGAQVRAVIAERERRAELDAAGFKRLGGA